ncbi:helix-turn-helix transcriptional regulator [Dermabacteraceae bacterium P7006]
MAPAPEQNSPAPHEKGAAPANQAPPLSRLWTSAETAEVLGVTEAALRKMRMNNDGPRFIKFGRRVRYSGRAVAEWIKEARCTN